MLSFKKMSSEWEILRFAQDDGLGVIAIIFFPSEKICVEAQGLLRQYYP